MSYRLVDQAPRGSALSAYGMARGFRWNLPLLALVAGSLVLVAAAMAWWLSRPVLVPRYPLLLVTARPAVIHAAMHPDQRAALPVAWGRAVATKSHLPAVFAVALDEEGAPHAFAALPGKPFGHETVPTVSVARWSLPGFWSTFRADAAFALRGDLLTAWLLQTSLVEDPHMVMTGVWQDGVGRLDTAVDDAAMLPDAISQLAGAMGDDALMREVILASLLSQGIDLRALSQAPSALSLAVSPLENRVLALTWTASLSPEDRVRVEEAGATVSLDGLQASFADVATTTADIAPFPTPALCPGTPSFVLSGVALQRAFHAFHAPAFLRDQFQTFSLTADGDIPTFCLR